MQESEEYHLLHVEESLSTLHRVASPDVAVALQQRSGVASAFGRRRHTSRASSAARESITRAARASLRKELSWALVNAGWSQSQCGLPKWPGRGHRTCSR